MKSASSAVTRADPGDVSMKSPSGFSTRSRGMSLLDDSPGVHPGVRPLGGEEQGGSGRTPGGRGRPARNDAASHQVGEENSDSEKTREEKKTKKTTSSTWFKFHT